MHKQGHTYLCFVFTNDMSGGKVQAIKGLPLSRRLTLNSPIQRWKSRGSVTYTLTPVAFQPLIPANFPLAPVLVMSFGALAWAESAGNNSAPPTREKTDLTSPPRCATHVRPHIPLSVIPQNLLWGWFLRVKLLFDLPLFYPDAWFLTELHILLLSTRQLCLANTEPTYLSVSPLHTL